MGFLDKVKDAVAVKEFVCERCGKVYTKRPLLGTSENLCPDCAAAMREERRAVDEVMRGVVEYRSKYGLKGFSSEEKQQAYEKRAADIAKYAAKESFRREEVKALADLYEKWTLKEAAFIYDRLYEAAFETDGANMMMNRYYLASKKFPGVMVDVDDVFAITYYTPSDINVSAGKVFNYIFFTNNPYIPVLMRTEYYTGNGADAKKENTEAYFQNTCKNLTYPIMPMDQFKKELKQVEIARGNLTPKFMLTQIDHANYNTYMYAKDEMALDLCEGVAEFLEEIGYYTKEDAYELLQLDNPKIREVFESGAYAARSMEEMERTLYDDLDDDDEDEDEEA